jgi:dinuclear metal center YbgI/SA1388 family protein
MKLTTIIMAINQIAPTELAAEWDNVGLLAGDLKQNVSRVLLTIDLTAAVAAEAKTQKADLVIAYHPPIFEPIKKIVAGAGLAALLYDLIRAGRAIYSLHTALDVVADGVNDSLADIIGIEDPQPLEQAEPTAGTRCKLVVFVPESDLTAVSEAIFAAGAGNIGAAGKYSKCSFRTRGTGTFQCGPASRPTVGKRGRFEQVDEYRLESIVPAEKLAAVMRAMRAAHSYEEPAFDIIPLIQSQPGAGLGRFGKLKKPMTVDALIQKIKKALKVRAVGVIGPRRRTVRTAAVGAGSCGTLFREAVRQGCDFYLTGELKHHHALELAGTGMTGVCVGHWHSERFILARLVRELARRCPGVTFTVSKTDKNPFELL